MTVDTNNKPECIAAAFPGISCIISVRSPSKLKPPPLPQPMICCCYENQHLYIMHILFECVSGYCYKLSHDFRNLEKEFNSLHCVCCKVGADASSGCM